MKKTNNLFSNTFKLSFFVFSILIGSFIFHTVKGSGCERLEGDDKLKCEELEKKAEAYRNLIEIKNKQQNTLQNQMELIDKEQDKNKTELEQTEIKIENLKRQITQLEREVSDKEETIKYQKSMLAGLVRSYYESYQQGLLRVVLISKDFSDIMNQPDYVEQSGTKVTEILIDIKEAKEKLEERRNTVEQKKYEVEMLAQKLEHNQKDLESTETKKQSLLAQTQGEEERYKKLLERVEEQKKELFNFSEAGNLAEVLGSVSSFPKPDSKYWASESWYYSQRDPRWGSSFIGNSRSNLKDWGCAVTSVSMISTFFGNRIAPGVLAKQPIFAFDLIKWNLGGWNESNMSIGSAYGYSHGNINWSVIDKMIENKIPVIVNIKKTNGKGGHYVVIHNKDKKDYVVHDPYFGSNIYLNTTRSLMGAIGDKSSTTIDQMVIYDK